MKRRLSQPAHKRLRRTAFTLVELLVAMTIFVLLSTITVTAFRGSDSDRVSNAAAAFKNALEGAKSRAVKSSEPRGLRLILSPNNGRQVTSLVYTDGGRVEEGKLRLEYNISTGLWQVLPEDWSRWDDLYTNKLIIPGVTRLKVSDSPSKWVILSHRIGATGPWWSITGSPPEDLVQDFPPGSPAPEINGGKRYLPDSDELSPMPLPPYPIGRTDAVASVLIDYKIQLEPTILAGAEPIALPPNTCIDLDSSKVPESWRPNPANGRQNYGPFIKYPDGTYSVLPMNILFTPKGTLARPLTTEGILHFWLGSTLDVDLWNGNQAASSLIQPFYNENDIPNSRRRPFVLLQPERGAKLVSIMTQTGSLMNADIFQSKPEGPAFNKVGYDFNDSSDRVLPTPYTFILYGKESK